MQTVMIVVAVAFVLTALVAGRVFHSRQSPDCVRPPAVCAADVGESAPLLSHDDEPERHLEIVQVASSELAAAATPTTVVPAFDDLAPMPSFRLRHAINPAALAAMNQGDELPAGFRFVSEE